MKIWDCGPIYWASISSHQLYETTSEEEDNGEDTEQTSVQSTDTGVVDLEDLGKVMKKMKTAKVSKDKSLRIWKLND